MIADNVQHIRRRIASACARAGRSADDVTLVAVSKTFDSSYIREAVEAGVIDIGENFVQELVQKRDEVHDPALSVPSNAGRDLDFVGRDIRWHFVGHLQTNKVKYIAGWIYLIHSVDSVRLGREINKHAERSGRAIDVLVEVNTSGEATKYGVQPEQALSLVEELSKLQLLRVRGLMTIGPFPAIPQSGTAGELPNPEASRPAFRTLRDVRDSIQQKGFEMPHLSMGMTNDFEVAIEEGSTIVRMGTAIFGQRG